MLHSFPKVILLIWKVSADLNLKENDNIFPKPSS